MADVLNRRSSSETYPARRPGFKRLIGACNTYTVTTHLLDLLHVLASNAELPAMRTTSCQLDLWHAVAVQPLPFWKSSVTPDLLDVNTWIADHIRDLEGPFTFRWRQMTHLRCADISGSPSYTWPEDVSTYTDLLSCVLSCGAID